MSLIALYSTEEEATAALADLEDRAKVLWAAVEFTVDGNSIVPKNAATGADAPDAQHVTAWDTVRQFAEGWGFASPRPRYPDHADVLLAEHAVTEMEIVEMEPEE